jgi:hypothetical protein
MSFAVIAISAIPPSIQAQEWLFEVSRHSFDIDGDFDDSILLNGPDFALNVPALQQVDGLGFAFGLSLGNGSFTLTHVRANPESLSVLGDATAAFRSWGLELAFAPWLDRGFLSFSPLVRLGGAFALLRVPDAASEGNTVEQGGFNGLQFNLGAGGMLRISQRLQVSADFSRRFLNFTTGTGYDATVPIDDGLSGTTNAFTVAVGLRWG